MIRIVTDNVLTQYQERLMHVENTCTLLKKRINDLELENEAFRNKVLRKVQASKNTVDDDEKTQSLYQGQLIPDK